jgi:regulator of sirC expression with transglutaminase-like and TPR domain
VPPAPPRGDAFVSVVRRGAATPERAALLLAAEFRPGLRAEAGEARLDAIADEVGRPPSGADAEAMAHHLAAGLHERLGFRGNAEDYYDPDNSDLFRVIERRRGLPITMSVLQAAVGRRVGISVALIGFPGHFITRVGGEDGVLTDPFAGGAVIGEPALARMAARFLGGPDRLDPDVHLAPVGVRALVVRMLLNLKNAFERRADHARALIACDRLVDLAEGPQLRRDRGLLLLRLGAVEAAMTDLEHYLSVAPRAKDASMVTRALAEARERVAPLS